MLGPGAYNHEAASQKKKAPAVFSGFNCTEQRFQDNVVKETTPGPGAYELASAQSNAAKSMLPPKPQNCVFGSTSRRFI